MFKRKKKRQSKPSESRVGIFTIPDSHDRMAKSHEHEVLLKEWELLSRVFMLSNNQRRRYNQLSELLWPPDERNPMNGIRRVPGGHGHPINYKQHQKEQA